MSIIKLTLAFMVLLLSACATVTPNIHSNISPNVDIRQFKTFGFFEPLDTDSRYESLLSHYLKSATTKELENRGLNFTQHKPDLLINFHHEIANKSEVSQIPITTGGYYHYRGHIYYDTWTEFEPYIDRYQEGVLTIDIVDSQHNKMIWQGIAIGRTSSKALGNLEETIPPLVTDIFSQLPLPLKNAPQH